MLTDNEKLREEVEAGKFDELFKALMRENGHTDYVDENGEVKAL